MRKMLLVNPSKKSTSISSSKISSSLPIPNSLQCNNINQKVNNINNDNNNNNNNNNNNIIKTLERTFHKHGFKTATVHSSNHNYDNNKDRGGGNGSYKALSVKLDHPQSKV